MNDARSERLKAALRENLKRRKAQSRGRESPRPAPAGAGRPPDDPGSPAGDKDDG